MECQICIEKFNTSKRSKVICMFCKKEACKLCIQTYILTNTIGNPLCMFCKNEWNREFQVINFSDKFINIDLKERRKNMLLARESLLLPNTMSYVIYNKNVEKCKKELLLLSINKTQYKKQLDDIVYKLTSHLTVFDIIKDKLLLMNIIKFDEKYNSMYKKYIESEELHDCIKIVLNASRHEYAINKSENSDKNLIKKCPSESCIGYLNTNFNCILCNIEVCKKCFIIIVHPHKCKEQDLLNKKYLDKNAVPCPACGTQIERVSGCNDMWCILCKTPFNYQTGKIITGTFHNPEYDKYRRSTSLDLIGNLLYNKKLDIVYNFIRHNQTKLERDNYNIDNKLSNLRIKYVEKNISESEWKINILRHDKKYQFIYDYKVLLREFLTSCQEINNKYCTKLNKISDDILSDEIINTVLDKININIDIFNENVDKLKIIYKYKNIGYRLDHLIIENLIIDNIIIEN